jgi:hypothetical protein
MRDIPGLTRLVSATEQDDQSLAASHKINPVSRAAIDPQFAYAVKELGISEKTGFNAYQPHGNANLSLPIPQPSEPSRKIRMLADLDHL